MWTNQSNHLAVVIMDESVGHCFMNMVGYCVKDRGQCHFGFISKNLTRENIIAGIAAHLRGQTKIHQGKIIISKKYMGPIVLFYYEHKLMGLHDICPLRLMVWMLHTGEYAISEEVLTDNTKFSPNIERMQDLFTAIVNPASVTRAMLLNIFLSEQVVAVDYEDYGLHSRPRARATDDQATLNRLRLIATGDDDKYGHCKLQDAVRIATKARAQGHVGATVNRDIPRPDVVSDDDEDEDEQTNEDARAAGDGEAAVLEQAEEVSDDPVVAVQAGLSAHLEARGYKRGDTARYSAAAARTAIRTQRVSNRRAARGDPANDDVQRWTPHARANARHEAQMAHDMPNNNTRNSDSEGDQSRNHT